MPEKDVVAGPVLAMEPEPEPVMALTAMEPATVHNRAMGQVASTAAAKIFSGVHFPRWPPQSLLRWRPPEKVASIRSHLIRTLHFHAFQGILIQVLAQIIAALLLNGNIGFSQLLHGLRTYIGRGLQRRTLHGYLRRFCNADLLQ